MYGIIVDPDPTRRAGKWFLHRCVRNEHVFQYNPDRTTWLSFDTIEEAQKWFNIWYFQKKQARDWLPDKNRFTIIEIPIDPVIKAITKDIVEQTNDEETDIRLVV